MSSADYGHCVVDHSADSTVGATRTMRIDSPSVCCNTLTVIGKHASRLARALVVIGCHGTMCKQLLRFDRLVLCLALFKALQQGANCSRDSFDCNRAPTGLKPALCNTCWSRRISMIDSFGEKLIKNFGPWQLCDPGIC